MSFTVKLNVSKLWHPTSGQDAYRLMFNNIIKDDLNNPPYCHNFFQERKSYESSCFYIDGIDNSNQKIRIESLGFYISKIGNWPGYFRGNQRIACYVNTSNKNDEGYGMRLLRAGDYLTDFNCYYDWRSWYYNDETGLWTINGGSDHTNSDYLRYLSNQLQNETEIVINIDMPFVPVFSSEELAQAYLNDIEDETIYKQALNYYNPQQYSQPIDYEKYQYENIQKALQSYASQAKSITSYSSNLFIQNVLDPIYRLIKRCKGLNYDNNVNELKNKIANDIQQYIDFKNMDLIEAPSKYTGQTPVELKAPHATYYSYSPFNIDDISIMEAKVFEQYASSAPVTVANPFFLSVDGKGYDNELSSEYYVIRVVHNENETDLGYSNIRMINNTSERTSLDEKAYFSIFSSPLYLTNVNGKIVYAATFRYYKGLKTCSNWIDGNINGSNVNLYHSDSFIIGKNNQYVPFYCSSDIYVAGYDKKTETLVNYKWLEKSTHLDPTRDEEATAKNLSAGMIHIKPILTLFNRHGLANINGWDGNKLKIADGYLIAPQVGAGIKSDDNVFTGVIMGVKQVQPNSDRNQRIGMFGYYKGIQSFFLNSEDGSAIFGLPGAGQIIIDPKTNEGMLYSSNYWKNYSEKDGKPSSYEKSNWNEQGMLINLTKPEIRYGNGNFVVTESGHATIAGGGHIAGWKITDTTIESDITAANGKLVLDSGATVDETLDENGNKVYHYNYGKIYCGRHNELGVNKKGFYLGFNGFSINNGNRSGLIFDMNDYPKIYSNQHETINDVSTSGFHLSQDGLCISNREDADNRAIFRISTSDGGGFNLYSGNGATYEQARQGFSLGSGGLFIKSLTGSMAMDITGNPALYSGGRSSLSAGGTGFYLSQDGFSIRNGTNNEIAFDLTKSPVLYSNGYTAMNMTNPNPPSKGFHLGDDGLGINSTYTVTTAGGTERTEYARFAIKTNGNPVIYSNSFESIDMQSQPTHGFHIGEDGIAVYGTYDEVISGTTYTKHSKFVIKTNGNPIIYSGSHSSLTETGSGFYIGNDGLSIGNTFRVTAAEGGSVIIGRIIKDSQGQIISKHWTINGDANNSYIGYNADAFGCTNLHDPYNYTINGNTNSVYIGTDGIRLGKKFAVDNTGNLLTKHLVVNCGSTEAESSWIGNWQFTNANMGAVNPNGAQWDRLWFSTAGTIKAEKWNVRPNPSGQEGRDYTTTWSINPDGTATFSTVNIPANKNMNVAGALTVTGTATVTGSLTVSGTLTANSGGSIGGFTIGNGYIGTSGSTAYLSGTTVGGTNAIFTGTITASGVGAGNSTTLTGGNVTCKAINATSEIKLDGTKITDLFAKLNDGTAYQVFHRDSDDTYWCYLNT